ncbi:MAG TPA: hypothetical protein VG649_07215, partial [Candidatus Angelobacter sp.]|nr:hypothetical protein [Candidatus Angelobacter sp.]
MELASVSSPARSLLACSLTIITSSLRRMVGDTTSVPWSTAVLLAIGFPILKLFPHIQAKSIYIAVCVSAP